MILNSFYFRLKTLIQIFLIIFLIVSCKTSGNSSVDESDQYIRDIPSSEAGKEILSEETGKEDPEPVTAENKFVLTDVHADKLLESGITYRESRFYPVHRKGRLKYIEENIDNRGPSEYFILYSHGESSEETEKDYLAGRRGLEAEILADRYLAAVYTGSEGSLVLKEILPLSHRPVFREFSVIKLSVDSSEKAVVVSFSGEEGLSDNLITVSGRGDYSVFSMNSTLTEFNRIEDIDNDGKTEILRYENLFEEGLGYDTFITLFEYKNGSFESSGSLSVIRRLKEFLADTEKTLEAKNIDSFLRNSVPSGKLTALRERNLGSRDIIRKIFYPVKKESELFPDINVFMKNGSKIDFVFPEIVENPFRFDRRNIYNFTTYVRVSSESREEAIYLVKIYMNSNPFASPRFSFHIN